jgi:hypothetical protein
MHKTSHGAHYHSLHENSRFSFFFRGFEINLFIQPSIQSEPVSPHISVSFSTGKKGVVRARKISFGTRENGRAKGRQKLKRNKVRVNRGLKMRARMACDDSRGGKKNLIFFFFSRSFSRRQTQPTPFYARAVNKKTQNRQKKQKN